MDGKYERGIALLTSCANRGHGGCAQTLGAAYYAGRWIEFDMEKAIRWQSLAYQTGITYEFSGVYGAISLATIMCDQRNRKGGYEKYRSWIEKAKVLLNSLARNLSRMHSKNELVFEALVKKISQIEKSISAESCRAR